MEMTDELLKYLQDGNLEYIEKRQRLYTEALDRVQDHRWADDPHFYSPADEADVVLNDGSPLSTCIDGSEWTIDQLEQRAWELVVLVDLARAHTPS